MKELLTLNYWFNTRPEPIAGQALVWAIIFLVILLVLAIIFKVLGKKPRSISGTVLAKWYRFFLTNFIIGLFIVFFNFEMVPILASYFWSALWVIFMIAWLVVLIIKIKKLAKKKQEAARDDGLDKYIPK